MPTRGLFVTGTDTEIGKTWVSRVLMEGLKQAGFSAMGMKPVAAGCEMTPDGLRNEDAALLRDTASHDVDYDWVNPYAFEPPIAPHIAAELTGESIDIKCIQAAYTQLQGLADWVVVEGVGGWAVPLSASESVADIAVRLKLPVVLVVGLRLGCLNHALLTSDAIVRSGCHLVGWIGNEILPNYLEQSAALTSLANRIPAPCLGVLPYMRQGFSANVVDLLDMPLLLDLYQEVR